MNLKGLSMKDQDKTKEQLIQELVECRKSVSKAKEALEENFEKYKIIAEHTTDFIAITTFDFNANFVYLSPSYSINLGYDTEKLIGTSSLEFIHPDDKKKFLPLMKGYLLKKTKGLFSNSTDKPLHELIEYRVRDTSGNYHILESTANIAGNKLLFVSKDITKRKKTELELAKKLHSLETFQKISTGRELKMIELKKRIHELEKKKDI